MFWNDLRLQLETAVNMLKAVGQHRFRRGLIVCGLYLNHQHKAELSEGRRTYFCCKLSHLIPVQGKIRATHEQEIRPKACTKDHKGE